MLNFLQPRYMAQLSTALDLILNNSSSTIEIKEGETLLTQLKQKTQYSELIANQLLNNTNFNKTLFLLLQLQKQGQLSSENVWWHLVQCYYFCHEKSSNVIVQILLKPFHFQQCKFSYFLQPIRTYQNWGHLQMDRLLKLVHILVDRLQKDNLNNIFCLKTVYYTLQNNELGPVIQQRVVIQCLRLSLIKKQHREIPTKYNSKLTKFLIQLDKKNGFIDQTGIRQTLRQLLNKRYKHYEYTLKLIYDIYPYKIGNYWEVILLQYRQYIGQIIQNIRNENRLKQYILSTQKVQPQFYLLSKLVSENKQHMFNILMKEKEVNILCVVASTKLQLTNIQPLIVQVLQKELPSFKDPYLLSALKYISYSCDDLNPQFFLPICTALVKVRKMYSPLQNICDCILQLLVPSLITLLPDPQLWNFAYAYIQYLVNNQLNVTSHTFLPPLLILQHTLQYWLGNNQQFCEVQFPYLCNFVYELLKEKQNEPEESPSQIAYKLIQLYNKYYKVYNNASQLTQKLIKYIDINQLYNSLDSAQLYTLYFLRQRPINYDDFVNNLLELSFWEKLCLNDIPFYTGIFIGLIENESKIQYLNNILINIVTTVSKEEDNWRRRLEDLRDKFGEYGHKLNRVLGMINSLIQ